MDRTAPTTPALRGPASVLALALWACALVLTIPLLASMPAAAETSAGRRDAAPAATQAPVRVRVVNHNIEKRPVALRRALKSAARTGAQVILLQEVCWWQAADVRRQHPGWTIAYIAERNRDRCRNRGYPGDTLGLRKQVGNLAIWTGGPSGSTSAIAFDNQRIRNDNAGLACVAWVDVVRHRACSAHLIAPQNGSDVRTRTRQARDTARIAAPWIRQDDLVILGGDFNAQPRRRTMRFLYARGGKGEFREAGGLRSRGGSCACRRGTIDKRKAKIDYVFFSANRTSPRTLRRLRVVRTVSDHHLLVGWADVNASVR